MFEVTATTPAHSCNGKNCPLLAVDPATGDVLVQGDRTDASVGLPALAEHEARVVIPGAVWRALLAQHAAR